jgi:hypothetical protein
MREYLDWQQERGPVRIRIHRRVLAGLERQGAQAFRGVALGSISPEAREVVVEDFALLGPGGEFGEHVLPAVGYFQSGLELTEDDRDRAARQFSGKPHVVLLFEAGDDGVRLARVLVEPNGLQPPRRPATPSTHRVRFRAAEPPPPVVEQPETDAEPRWRRFLWPAVASVGGFLVGVAAYMALHGPAPNDPVTVSPPRSEAPITPSVTPGSNEADRSMFPARPDAPLNRAEVQQQVRVALDRWSSSLLANDLDTHVGVYAPYVGPYFAKTRVTRAGIADEVRQTVKRYGPMKEYRITDLTIAVVDANHAIANFHKQWSTAGSRFAGAEREQLKLTRQGSEWLITSEQELKVYWVRRK